VSAEAALHPLSYPSFTFNREQSMARCIRHSGTAPSGLPANAAGPKAKRAAELGELAAKLIERKDQENRARLAELVEVAGPPLVPGNC
jgi:hypothetical protein